MFERGRWRKHSNKSESTAGQRQQLVSSPTATLALSLSFDITPPTLTFPLPSVPLLQTLQNPSFTHPQNPHSLLGFVLPALNPAPPTCDIVLCCTTCTKPPANGTSATTYTLLSLLPLLPVPLLPPPAAVAAVEQAEATSAPVSCTTASQVLQLNPDAVSSPSRSVTKPCCCDDDAEPCCCDAAAVCCSDGGSTAQAYLRQLLIYLFKCVL